jgi:hypothetical protein
MEIIDSTQTLLPGPEVIARAIYNAPNSLDPKYSNEAILTAAAGETALPNTNIIQIGNTVFVSHRGKGPNKKKITGFAYNVDTDKQLIVNVYKYIKYLRKRKIARYSIMFNSVNFLQAFQVIQRRAKQEGLEVGIARSQKNPNIYMAFVRLQAKQQLRERT